MHIEIGVIGVFATIRHKSFTPASITEAQLAPLQVACGVNSGLDGTWHGIIHEAIDAVFKHVRKSTFFG